MQEGFTVESDTPRRRKPAAVSSYKQPPMLCQFPLDDEYFFDILSIFLSASAVDNIQKAARACLFLNA